MPTCPQGHPSDATDYCDVCGAPITADPVQAADTSHGSGAPGGFGGSDGGAGTQPCPHCGGPNAIDALFCEACGYDFTTGSMPRPLTPPSGPGTRTPAPTGGTTPAPAAPGSEAAGATAVASDVSESRAGGSGAATSTPAGSDAPLRAPASASPPAEPGDADPGSTSWVVEMWVDPAWYAAQESPDPLPSAGAPAVLPLRGRSLLVGRTSQSRNIHPDVDCGGDSGVSRRQCQLTTDGRRWWVEDLGSANGTFVGPASGALPEDPVPPGTRRELGRDDRVYLGAWTRLVVRTATEDERAAFATAAAG